MLGKQAELVTTAKGNLEVGSLVAVFLEGWTLSTKAMKPSIGIITQLLEDGFFKLNYYEGNWNTPWYIFRKNNEYWHDTLHYSSVVLFKFELDNNSKLTSQQKNQMRKAYRNIQDEKLLTANHVAAENDDVADVN